MPDYTYIQATREMNKCDLPDIPEPICDEMNSIHDGCIHDGIDVSYHEAMGYDFNDDSTDMSERGTNA